jgi:thiol-disulfide isomerase/thioredoxin
MFKPFLILIILCSTAYTANSQSTKKIKKGKWIGELQLSDSDVLPFELLIEKRKGSYSYAVINGDEKIRLQEQQTSGDSLRLSFPYFNSEIVFDITSKKTIRGLWYNHNKKNYCIPFQAKRDKRNRFINTTNANKTDFANVNGRWAVTFEPNTNSAYPAVGVFHQNSSDNTVSGTFLTETGDYRYLSGNTTKDSLYISCFDGSHAFLFKAKKEGEHLTGKFFSGKHWSSDWIAELNSKATIKDPEELTYVKDEGEVAFELQTIEGETFTFPNKALEDKVVIIQIMGSWCPNCLDETHYYKSLYEKYHDKGLEIISIGYETGDTFIEQSKSIARLKEKLVLDFIFLVGGKASKSLASDHFEMLNEVISFPTSIFIGRDGKVKRVHTGFNGPGTGVYYQEYIEKTNALIESLLAH